MDWRFSGERIKLAREANGISQEQLAVMAGTSQTQLSQWERGEVKPGQDSLMKVCNALKTPPRFFFVQDQSEGQKDAV